MSGVIKVDLSVQARLHLRSIRATPQAATSDKYPHHGRSLLVTAFIETFRSSFPRVTERDHKTLFSPKFHPEEVDFRIGFLQRIFSIASSLFFVHFCVHSSPMQQHECAQVLLSKLSNTSILSSQLCLRNNNGKASTLLAAVDFAIRSCSRNIFVDCTQYIHNWPRYINLESSYSQNTKPSGFIQLSQIHQSVQIGYWRCWRATQWYWWHN